MSKELLMIRKVLVGGLMNGFSAQYAYVLPDQVLSDPVPFGHSKQAS